MARYAINRVKVDLQKMRTRIMSGKRMDGDADVLTEALHAIAAVENLLYAMDNRDRAQAQVDAAIRLLRREDNSDS